MEKHDKIIKKLKSLSNPEAVKGMAGFGINPKNVLGVSIPNLRMIAKEAGKNHGLARQLWASGIHEARLLASFVGESDKLTEKQIEKWVKGIDSRDICDQCCSNLFDKTRFAWKKAVEWTKRDEEFVKRAGFVLMACLSVHDKKAADEEFERFFPIIKKHANDERNFVKKAVNWALRQIGKRNIALNKKAIKIAKEIHKMDSNAAKWIANDALCELTNEKTIERLKKKKIKLFLLALL